MSLRKNVFAGLFSLLAIAFSVTTVSAAYPYPYYPSPYPQPAQANDGTGLTLGVYVQQNYYGMQIIGLMPNSSAQFAGLRSGDVLIEMYANGTYFPTTDLYELRTAKMSIGPNQLTYVRVFRPGLGEFYPMVTFQADFAGPAPAIAYSKQGGVAAAMKAPAVAKWSGQTEMSKKVFKDRPKLKIKSDLKIQENLKVDPNVKINAPIIDQNKNSNPWLKK